MEWNTSLLCCVTQASPTRGPRAGRGRGLTASCSFSRASEAAEVRWSRSTLKLELSINHRKVWQCLEKAPTRVYSLFKASTRAFAIKNLWRHCAEQVLKLGRRHNKDQNQRMAFRIFANQTAHWLWSLHWHPSRDLLRTLWNFAMVRCQLYK